MERILSPCFIGKCELKNRFVMTAANLGWCQDGYVTEEVIAFYRERAKGKVGLIIAGAAGVDPVLVNRVGMMQIYDDCFIPPMKRLTEEIHKEGSKIFLQLMHAGAYARQAEHDHKTAVAPSEYLCRFTGETTKKLEKEEINQIILYFKKAAARAVQAGFDGVELIGSAGYLIAEFLSKATNHREDEYGGSLENRARFLLEIVDAVRNEVGENFPIMVRLSGTDFIPGGNGPMEVIEIAKLLDKKVDAINITGGWHETSIPQITYHVPRGMYGYLAKAVKDVVSVPVIGCNRLDVDKARELVENGYGDMAGILRGLIADPYLVKKYIEGKEKEIRPCLSCNQCLDRIFSCKKLNCAVNPFVGRESEKREEKTKGKSILVVGAGVSGMAYASLMAKNNHITIWEKTLRYGGAGNVVASLCDRQEVRGYLDYLFGKCISLGVHFEWNKEATIQEIKENLKEDKFDKVVIGAGSGLTSPPYEIEEMAPVYRPEEYILSDTLKGKNIVIIGSGYKAVQTAQYCAKAKKTGEKEQEFLSRYAPEFLDFANNVMDWGKTSVTLLSPDKKLGYGFGKSTRWMMLREIKQMGITVETEVKIKRIGRYKVTCLIDEREKEIPADLVILGEGWEKNLYFTDQLAKEMEEETESVFESEKFVDKIQIIGDAKRPGRISEAVDDAYRAAAN